ncbi:MAG TPA: hypothetical protein VKV34_08840 [Thermoleophilia bacterium]|nr:hypothetical protein [Thermoleophilia bacterium]
MTVLDTTLAAVIRADAEALEHAMREGRVTDPETVLPGVLVQEIALSNSEAYALPGGMGALIASDYDADPWAFCARMVVALRVSVQLHDAEALLPLLTGTDPATYAAILATLDETAGPGEDGHA